MVFIKSFKSQNWLLPPRIEDMIPKDHVCFLAESLIESLDFSFFVKKYAGVGHPAYHPRILLKILVMGILDKVRSSRMLAKNARENIIYIYLSEKLSPDFRTISDFRKNNPELLKIVFKHTLILAKEEGALDLSHLSTDGSKVKANASNKNVLTKQELDSLDTFINNELEEWTKQDQIEDKKFENLRGFDQLPNSSKKRIKATVKRYIKETKCLGIEFKQAINEKINDAKKELKDKNLEKISLTDGDSRFMKNKKGKIELSYNVQITVGKNGIILANDVCQDPNDLYQLQPQVNMTEENLGTLPNVPWSFDKGFYESGNIKFLSDKKIEGYIPDNLNKTDNPFDKKHFIYDAEKDVFICPANNSLTFTGEQFDKSKKKKVRLYKGQSCKTCLCKQNCTKSKRGIRRIKVFPFEKERKAMDDKMKTQNAKETYKLRAETVEPVFGDIKENKGFRAFLTRHLETVKNEFNLVCAASNLRRIYIILQKRSKLKLSSGTIFVAANDLCI